MREPIDGFRLIFVLGLAVFVVCLAVAFFVVGGR